MLSLTLILCSVIISGALLLHAALRERADLRQEIRHLTNRLIREEACLSGTLEILSKHYPLRNDKSTLDALRSGVLEFHVPSKSH